MAHSLILLLSFLFLGAVAALFWRDVVIPRRHRRANREMRREQRRRSEIRFRFFKGFWDTRKIRRLTDQRDVKSSYGPQDAR